MIERGLSLCWKRHIEVNGNSVEVESQVFFRIANNRLITIDFPQDTPVWDVHLCENGPPYQELDLWARE